MKKLFLVLFALCFIISSNNEISAEKAKPAPGIALEDTKGQFTLLSSLAQQGNLIISFWSYDCVPCRKEMPELQELARSSLFKDKNVKVVFVYVEATTEKTAKGTEDRPPKDKALEVLKKLNITETCLLDIYGITFNKYREVSGIKKATLPLLYLLNKNKEIVFQTTGFNEDNLKKLKNAIKTKL